MNYLGDSSAETKYFFELTPERILKAVEAEGIRCTGRVLTLNSMENRVYEIEVEVDDPTTLQNPSERFRIAKFYRPGRWTREQIEEEHQYLFDLEEDEIPVVAPVRFSDDTTVRGLSDVQIFFALFPKRGGRLPDELSHEQLEQLGRLLARAHVVGRRREAKHRIRLTPETYGLQNLEFLLKTKSLPSELERQYENAVKEVCELSAPYFAGVPVQRIHGDCHRGNIIWSGEGASLVDFDDMVVGPQVQDFWLMLSGDTDESGPQLEALLTGYEQFSSFDRSSLRLIEPLRALRFIHFSTWIARRWEDPAFQRAFPTFGGSPYWREQLALLEEQIQSIRALSAPPQTWTDDDWELN